MNLKKSSLLLYLSLFLTGVLTRLPLLEKFQSHWDGPDYTLALLHYSFVEQTPSPPGYPIYIGLGKFFHLFLQDPHLSILMVSVLFSGIGGIVFYLAGKTFFNRKVGVISFLLFISAPTIFYFGITANPYGILPTTAAIVATVVFLIVKKRKDLGFLLGLVLAFAVGIRPQDAIFLMPLYLLGLYYLNKKQRYVSIISLFVFSMIWFLPVSLAVGGINKYLSYVFLFTQNDAKPFLTLERLLTITPIIVKGMYLTCGISLLALIYLTKQFFYFSKKPTELLDIKHKPYFLVFTFWVTPSLLFNVFVRSDHAAHQMAYLSAFILMCSYFIVKHFSKKKKLFVIIAMAIVVFNLYTFFRDRDIGLSKPYVSQSYHYSEIVKNNIRVPAIVEFIKTFDSGRTIVIVDPEIFRPFTYYLKDYNVYAYSALDTIAPSLSGSVHFGYLYHYKHLVDKSNALIVQKDTKNIIVISNNKPYRIVGTYYKEVELSGGALLYVLLVNGGDKYHLTLHSMTKIR